MNFERPDEQRAKWTVERTLGVTLEHADKFGGVDYLSSNGRIAVEVTRVTEGRNRSTRNAIRKSRDSAPLESVLATCWWVHVPESGQRLDTLYQNVQPALVKLEHAGENFFELQRAAVHIRGQGPLSDIYKTLAAAGVRRATALQRHSHKLPTQPHRLIPLHDSSGSASDSDQALMFLMEAIGERGDNPKKLAESGAEQRHLFVWIDGDTPSKMARPLDRDSDVSNVDGMGLPKIAPVLNPAITHLWVVREGTTRGWMWDGTDWHDLKDVTERLT